MPYPISDSISSVHRLFPCLTAFYIQIIILARNYRLLSSFMIAF